MFEDVLIESSNRSGGSKTALTLPVSIAIHAIVIGLIVGASIWFVEDVPEPPIPVTFYAAAPRPRLRPRPPPRRPPKAPEVQKPDSGQVHRRWWRRPSFPTRSPGPSRPSRPRPAASREGSREASRAEFPAASSEASSGGTGGSGGGEEPLRVGGEVKAPVLQSKIEPTYPEAARKARMEGVVILEAIITASGSVEEVKVLKSVNPLLDASAVRAVSGWRYKPATLNGRAVRVYLTVTVTFNLH